LQEHFRHDLLERLIFQLLPLVERDTTPGLLLLLLFKRGDRVLPRCEEYFLTVNGGDGCVRRHWSTTGEPGGLIQQEAADKRHDDENPDVLRGAPHRLQHGARLLDSEDGQKRKGTRTSPKKGVCRIESGNLAVPNG